MNRKTMSMIVVLAIAASPLVAAVTFESAGAGARGLIHASRAERAAREAARLEKLPPLDLDDLITRPEIEALPHGLTLGREVGSFVLADRLDTHGDLFKLKLGASVWDTSIASDAEFKNVYFAFRRGDQLRLARIKDLNDLRKSGVTVKIDENTTYRFKVSINIFSPVRGSTLKIDPVNGTQGPRYEMKTGKVLDAVKAESFVFNAGGVEYWALYGTDVDPKTETLADTRSLLFIHENGTSSRAWPVGEAKLEPGKPVSVSLESKVTLLKDGAGVLSIREGGTK